MKLRGKFVFVVLFLLGTMQIAFAKTDEKIDLNYIDLQDVESRIHTFAEDAKVPKLDPYEAYKRTQAVLAHFEVPAEAVEPTTLDDMGPNFSFDELKKRLGVFDPDKAAPSFLSFLGSNLRIFKDKTSKREVDLDFDLNRTVKRPQTLRERILAAKRNPRDRQLSGLRIALDPGHMGSPIWDKRTGKFAKLGNQIVSEGEINLQECLLLKRELEKLGAIVLITHDDLAPVTNIKYENLDIKYFGKRELRADSLEPWFQKLLASAPLGKQLMTNFENSAQVKKIFGGFYRGEFFIKREDLDARAKMMNAFAPDITIYVHHDTVADGGVTNNSPNKTRLYVPGAFQNTEYATREHRRSFMQHWLDKDAWELSIQLARASLSSIEATMGIPRAVTDGTESIRVENGIFARNLLVPRKMRNTVTAYFEMFFYDRTSEFKALTDFKYTMQIGGKPHKYSERVVQAAKSLRDGIVNFVANAQ